MPQTISRNSTASPSGIRRFLIPSLTFVLILLAIQHPQDALAEAQLTITSLYIPGFEPESVPVSASILGVGVDGRTTWALHQGEATATATAHASDQSGRSFVGTATLVEGPIDASLTYANSAAHFTIGQMCSFSQGFAICTLVGGGSTAVQTELTSHVPVQVAPTQITSPVTTTNATPPLSSQQTSTNIDAPTASEPEVPSRTRTAGSGASASSNSPRTTVPRSGGLLMFVLLASLTSLMGL